MHLLYILHWSPAKASAPYECGPSLIHFKHHQVFCYYSYEVPSNSIPLEAAAEKDRVIRQQADEARHSLSTHSINTLSFHHGLYEQPALRADPVEPEPYAPDGALQDLMASRGSRDGSICRLCKIF